MTRSLTVEVPPEPPDRSVVLDRDTVAWQRDGDVWRRRSDGLWRDEDEIDAVGGIGFLEKSWGHLLVDLAPLTALVTEDDLADAPTAWERYALPLNFVAGTPGPRACWAEGDSEPMGVTHVEDQALERWQRVAGGWTCTGDLGLDSMTWPELTKRGPLFEVTPTTSSPETPDVATPAAGPVSDFTLRHAPGLPTVVTRRAVRDEPQA